MAQVRTCVPPACNEGKSGEVGHTKYRALEEPDKGRNRPPSQHDTSCQWQTSGPKVSTCCCVHIDSRTSVDMDTCIEADAHNYAHADASLLPLLPTVSLSSLTLMRRFAAPMVWGIRGSLRCVAFTPIDVGIADHLGSLLHRSGNYRGRVAPVGLLPERNYQLAIKHTVALVLNAYTTAQEGPQSQAPVMKRAARLLPRLADNQCKIRIRLLAV